MATGLEDFQSLAANIRTYRSMFLADDDDAIIFLAGYLYRYFTTEQYRTWNRYVNLRVGTPDNLAWTYAVAACAAELPDRETLVLDLADEFCQLIRVHGWEGVLIHTPVASEKDGEPERVVREFLTAVLAGDEGTLKDLVLPVSGAELMVSAGPYPAEAAEALKELWADQTLFLVSTSDPDHVQILCGAALGSVDLFLRDGRWLVDPTAFVERWGLLG